MALILLVAFESTCGSGVNGDKISAGYEKLDSCGVPPQEGCWEAGCALEFLDS